MTVFSWFFFLKIKEFKIKKMQKDGLRAKEISRKLNMPLRTVYYLLKR